MAKDYRLTPAARAANRVFVALTRFSAGAAYRHILTVPGRVSGSLHSTPVDVMECAGQRWLIAPYGETNWVRNVLAHPEIELRRGRRREHLRAEPVPPADSVAAIRTYLHDVPVTHDYWNVTAGSSDADIVADAGSHPVFRLRSTAR